ncbi:MAG: YXWGXW repeat-containing protein [Proteobacteria bacterium]|nr:YXWGXW repeat-containing protein [Pseudomonadota bacterium]
MLKTSLLTTLAAAAISLPALTVPALVTSAAAQANLNISIGTPPPAPIYEVIPAPRAGYVWAPGYYRYEGGHYLWTKGRWMAERPGYRWTNDRWEHGPHGWYHVPGRWDHAQAYRDRDHDGVPNAYDRHPDNPYRR